jgi:hypothetical protein
MKSKGYLVLMLVVVVGLLMASCNGGKKTAATAAIQAAEDAYNNAKTELMKYIPDQTKGVEDAINAAKASLDKHEYEAATTAAQAVPGKVKELTAAAAAKKDELAKSWEEMNGEIPKMLRAVRSKLTILSIKEEQPANMDKTKVKAARTAYEEATARWEEAQNAAYHSNLLSATAKADTVRQKVMEAMANLGLKVPAAPTKR